MILASVITGDGSKRFLPADHNGRVSHALHFVIGGSVGRCGTNVTRKIRPTALLFQPGLFDLSSLACVFQSGSKTLQQMRMGENFRGRLGIENESDVSVCVCVSTNQWFEKW